MIDWPYIKLLAVRLWYASRYGTENVDVLITKLNETLDRARGAV